MALINSSQWPVWEITRLDKSVNFRITKVLNRNVTIVIGVLKADNGLELLLLLTLVMLLLGLVLMLFLSLRASFDITPCLLSLCSALKISLFVLSCLDSASSWKVMMLLLFLSFRASHNITPFLLSLCSTLKISLFVLPCASSCHPPKSCLVPLVLQSQVQREEEGAVCCSYLASPFSHQAGENDSTLHLPPYQYASSLFNH